MRKISYDSAVIQNFYRILNSNINEQIEILLKFNCIIDFMKFLEKNIYVRMCKIGDIFVPIFIN